MPAARSGSCRGFFAGRLYSAAFAALRVAAEARLREIVEIGRPERLLLQAEFIKITPREQPCVVQIVEFYPDGVVPDRLQPHDADMAAPRNDLLLACTMALHFGGGAFNAQEFRRKLKSLAVREGDGENFFLAFQAHLGDFGPTRLIVNLARHAPSAISSSRASSTSMIGMPLRIG